MAGGWSGGGGGGAGGNGTRPANGTAAGNSTGAGGAGNRSGGGKPDYLLAMFARREVVNEAALQYLAYSLAGIVGIFILFHWSRVVVNRHIRRTEHPVFIPGSLRPFTSFSRSIRNILVRKVPGFTSAGHLLLVTVYVAINVVLAFTIIDTPSMSNYASRFGFLAAGNLFLVVFLALKNTPLAFLTAYSYERINGLHQVAGCLTFVWVILHASTYSSYFISTNKWDILRENEQIAGMVAGFCMLITVFAGLVIRRIWYEVFLVTHIVCFMAIIIALGFHRPDLTKAIAVIAILAGCIWALDRLLRFARLCIYGINNSATIHPLPNGGTKIILRKAPHRAVPGKHSFLWIPRIRALEMHPFSIVSTDPCEFIVCSRDGFTSSLHRYAVEHPGARLTASVDGCYGTFPDPMEYDKIILIAGGSGASFTFGLAVNLLQRMTETSTQSIVFIWAVKEHENLNWFSEHLNTLRTHPNAPKVNVGLHVTRGASRTASATSVQATDEVASPAVRRARAGTNGSLSSGYDVTTPDGEKTRHNHADLDEKHAALDKETGGPPRLPQLHAMTSIASMSSDPEKMHAEHAEHIAAVHANAAPPPAGASSEDGGHHAFPPPGHALNSSASSMSLAKSGRPDTASLIRNEVARTPPNQRILVAACGPSGLMRVVRDTTAGCIRGDGPAVELHCEQFGW